MEMKRSIELNVSAARAWAVVGEGVWGQWTMDKPVDKFTIRWRVETRRKADVPEQKT